MKLVQRESSGKISGEGLGSDLLTRVLSKRGIDSESELSIELKQLHPISSLLGIDPAVKILVDAFEQKQNILIVGDFDADGATATAVAVKAFKILGYPGQVDYLVPNRFEYGYGLTPEIVKDAQRFSPDIIITVDNGISSIEGVAEAKKYGNKVIITDHHLPGKKTPDAEAIINPNQKGDDFPSKNLAGVGVIFYMMLALKKALTEQGYFIKNDHLKPDLINLLDLVALGTVADVVPLDQNNRILVEQGLRRMRGGVACEGIQALFRIAKRNIRSAVSSDLGFACGPRLNAAGRLDDMSLGIECLLSEDANHAMEIAEVLDDLNVERRAIEDGMKAEALAALEELDLDELTGNIPPVICLYNPSWHQGVIGILAARIREKYHRPTVIFAPADEHDPDNSDIKGSARSIPTIHIRDTFDEVASGNPGLLDKFGGHAMAAGLTLDESKLEGFKKAICDVVARQADDETFEEIHYSDGELEADDFQLKHADQLRFAVPWGQHFPAPAFDNKFIIVNKRILKEKHLKMVLKPISFDSDGVFNQGRTVDAIAFNIDVNSWPTEGDEVHLLYRLEVNEFRETCSLQLMVEKLL
ncbi:single-stranded-DNA-specific exonuclease RecJ [Cocleimonas flava]|uniref:Single-stranded-DNA-specific exonuclease RecJ n=1 Tax=Cocleimonas flava TaxID=634765 RepID=A0A4R1FBU0_9GAMM|nr:single-stranded-DNA-specific exonuclease RecJ [Cocleimonas flava]TCJ88191.1 exonuclease RecJ [Cocleimonas flava]